MSDLRASQKAQNLARIRDNQRRSRARRKEYLQELEAKIRSCEQVGIEASSEIQTAARRVLDENRKLRALLYERGMSEPELVKALGGSPDRPFDQFSATSGLNTLLDRRITCNTISSTSSPIPPQTRATSLPRHIPSVSPIDIPPPRPIALSCNDSSSPSSIVSSMGTPPPSTYSAPFYHNNAAMTPPASDIKSEAVRYAYSYGQPYNNNNNTNNNNNNNTNNNTWNYANEYNVIQDPVTYYNTSSCVDAANIIRTMRSDVGPELEADLGCRVPNQDCYINNNVVFSMMDKYSNHHGAI